MDTVIMADVSAWQLVSAIALAIAVAATAGLRALLPLFLTGLAARAGWIPLGPPFGFLATNWALLVFGVATVLEIAGDKIPAVDHALDTVHTVLRPLAGSVLAAAVLSSVSDPATATAMGLIIGAPTALIPHAAKSTVRVISTATTGGLANPVLSVLEDVSAFLFFVFSVIVPILAAAVVLIVTFLIARRMLSRRRTPATA